jgi:hypothetical protein
LDVKDRIDSFPRTRLSEGTVQLEAREYDVYLDVPSGTGEFGWTLAVRGPTGRELPLRTGGASFDYEWFSREGSRIGTLRVTDPGRHVVRGTGAPGADVVFADDVVGDMGRTVLLAVAALVLLGAAGLVLVVLAIARRAPREARRWP